MSENIHINHDNDVASPIQDPSTTTETRSQQGAPTEPRQNAASVPTSAPVILPGLPCPPPMSMENQRPVHNPYNLKHQPYSPAMTSTYRPSYPFPPSLDIPRDPYNRPIFGQDVNYGYTAPPHFNFGAMGPYNSQLPTRPAALLCGHGTTWSTLADATNTIL